MCCFVTTNGSSGWFGQVQGLEELQLFGGLPPPRHDRLTRERVGVPMAEQRQVWRPSRESSPAVRGHRSRKVRRKSPDSHCLFPARRASCRRRPVHRPWWLSPPFSPPRQG